MSWLDDLLGNISTARSALSDQTGGAEAPADTKPAATSSTAPAMSPAVTKALQGLAALSPEKQAEVRHLTAALSGASQSLDHPAAEGGRLSSALENFGGKVLGFGSRPDAAPGGGGRFADVLKNGLLYHIYGDPSRNMKIGQGEVADALGVKTRVGALEALHPSAGHHSSRDGVHVDPATGGVRAPRLPIR